MPALESLDCHQDAVLWRAVTDIYGRTKADKYGDVRVKTNVVIGNPVSFISPEILKVRWEDVKKQMTLPNGNTVAIDALVVIKASGPGAPSNPDIPVGSRMWKGSQAELEAFFTDDTSFEPTVGIMYVLGFNDTPDLKNRSANTRRVLMLTRDRDALPTRG